MKVTIDLDDDKIKEQLQNGVLNLSEDDFKIAVRAAFLSYIKEDEDFRNKIMEYIFYNKTDDWASPNGFKYELSTATKNEISKICQSYIDEKIIPDLGELSSEKIFETLVKTAFIENLSYTIANSTAMRTSIEDAIYRALTRRANPNY